MEVHSGHLVNIHGDGVLPGSANSDVYVRVAEKPVRQLPLVRNEQD
jgi:hypothetical protein